MNPSPNLREHLLHSVREMEDQKDQERLLTRQDLERKIEGGDNDPDLLIRLAKLFPSAERLEILRKACTTDGPHRRGSRALHVSYVKALCKFNYAEASVNAADDALRIFPGDPWFELKRALTLPIVYDRPGDAQRWRRRYTRELAELPHRIPLTTEQEKQAALIALRHHTNFFLQYQMENDRELQMEYSALMRRIIAANHPEFLGPIALCPPKTGQRLRVGYISAHFNHHSVAKSHNGWIIERDRSRIEAYCYQIRGHFEESSAPLQAASDRCQEMWGSVAEICTAIRADGLHAAVFLDVGMEPLMAVLAETRLAPLQCVTWGHPATTGSANMDYYLSSELMEPAGAQACYSENLIGLPGIGVYYRKSMIPRPLLDARRARFGLRDESVVFLCAQSMFKYLPEHDDIFVRLAHAVPQVQFVFLQLNPEVGFCFEERLKRVFSDAGLSFEKHCIILPHLVRTDYSAINLASDVYLDSLEWSGFNTTMEAIACGLPVITLPGQFMRGRHSYAILTQLGITDTIASSKDDFVALAIRLATDISFRKSLTSRMAERHSQLYSDRRSVEALGDFLETEVRRLNGVALASGKV